MGTWIHAPARAGQTLALVVAVAFGFILGITAAPADDLERAAEQTQRSDAILDALSGDYGPDRTELADYELGALAPVYMMSELTGLDCWAVAADLMATRDYRPYMAPCLGLEDSSAVAVILGN